MMWFMNNFRLSFLLSCLVVVIAFAFAAGSIRAETTAVPAASFDIEFAFDGTGSMGPLIEQARAGASDIMDSVTGVDPGARFAVVVFRDRYYPAPEYEVLTPLTSDRSKLAEGLAGVRSVSGRGPRNTKSEGYNLAFERSVSDASLGWRPGSRKIVVVFGDAEPHGAGTAGLGGCIRREIDPNGLRTQDVLTAMRDAKRTLVMVLGTNDGGATLPCYESITGIVGSGSSATRAGQGDIARVVTGLVFGTLSSVRIHPALPFSLPGAPPRLHLTLTNRSSEVLTVEELSVTLPPGAAVMRSSLGSSASGDGGTVRWPLAHNLAPGGVITATVDVQGLKEGNRRFVAAARARLASAQTPLETFGETRLRVGQTVRVVLARPSGSGSVILRYERGRKRVAGNVPASGSLTVSGPSGRAVTVRVDRARLAAAGGLRLSFSGIVARASGFIRCAPGKRVGVTLVDANLAPDSGGTDTAAVTGAGCDISRRPASVIIP
jgi:von Willebrand factor type A domain